MNPSIEGCNGGFAAYSFLMISPGASYGCGCVLLTWLAFSEFFTVQAVDSRNEVYPVFQEARIDSRDGSSDDDGPRIPWAYVAPRKPPVPVATDLAVPFQNPIDAFVSVRLERAGLKGAPEASRETLIRRLSLDLIGLPPSPEEVETFLRDPGPEAYENLVDRLLASEQFGVRWAVPWLDYARYADSHGFQRDDFRDLWPYRDWVVNALNADMPFDQFTIEQIAGDLLPNATESQRVATGFNRCAPTNVEAGTDPEETRVNQIHDRVNTLGMVWLGTSLQCSQCHDHKHDPFTMRDYYGLFAFFNQTALEAERTDPNVPSSIQFMGPSMVVSEDYVPSVANKVSPDKSEIPAPTTLVMVEVEEPRQSRLFLRGDFRNPGDLVFPQTPAALHTLRSGSGDSVPTRLDLARWLVDVRNPLVARVTVNRWWAELFGNGLVPTPEEFGSQGKAPTHPELLDWLAREFMDGGWSMKHILRTIVLSKTYRQSSRISAELLKLDDRNFLYARGPRFRLDAERIRDNALAIAGLLDWTRGGPPIRPYQPEGVWLKVGGQRYEYEVSPGGDRFRRGLYVVWKRGAPYPSFVNFDANSRMACRVERPRSNTPMQALTLMNDPVYVEAARGLAIRILMECRKGSDDERIEYGYLLATGRRGQREEREILSALLDSERQARLLNPQSAEDFVGDQMLPEGISAPEFCGWYAVAAALLNLDETISKG